MAQKGLGTGLGALFGDAALEETKTDFTYLPITRIEPRPDQPRSVFEQDKIDELTDSIREHGVLSPLTVRDMDGEYYQIIAGERRWRAARAAGLSEVPARIIVADDKTAMEIALVENLQREDLSPLEEAQGYKQLLEDFGMTQEEVSQRVSKSRPAVANALRLLNLPAKVKELVGAGTLPAGSARALLALPDAPSINAAAERAVRERMSVREVESMVRQIQKARNKKPKPENSAEPVVDYIAEAQNELTAALGRRVNIRYFDGRGKIELEYYDSSDFDNLFDALKSLTGQ